MANTTYLNLKKPSLDDDALIADINDNMDKIDAAVEKGSEAIAIVSIGDTHGAIAAGQYVYVRGHNSLAEGLYTANSAIAANATLSSSNVTAVSGGALNALNGKIANLVKRKEIVLEPGALAAGASGYLTGTPPVEAGYTPWIVDLVPANVGTVGGSLVLNGTVSTSAYYVGYYALTALSATNTKIAMRIFYIKDT